MLNSVKCKNVKMYFSQIFPMIFLLISKKLRIFAAKKRNITYGKEAYRQPDIPRQGAASPV